MNLNKQRLVAVALLVLLPAAAAFPWASVYPAEPTHQYIVDTVWKRLQADPAFEAKLFPNIYEIKDNEGMEFGLVGEQTGKGADAPGMSTYSEHYYNPVTNEGKAPASVARYYSVLIRDNLLPFNSKSAEAGPKAAAYSAHFLADICVPYHVNGTSRANAEQIWLDQWVIGQSWHAGTITLPETITGSPVLAYLTPIKGGNQNFFTELSRFLIMTKLPEYDWFDPWYYNGDVAIGGVYYEQSSHILWEGRPTGEVSASAFHEQAGQGLDGYDPHWKNATPTFDNPWVSQSEQARQFTIFKATETRNLQGTLFDNPALALRNTIRAVYTLWRGSISGLRPEIEYQPDGAGSRAYRVTGKATNAASAAASGLRARLTATGCTVVPDKALDKDKAKPLGSSDSSLAAGNAVSVSWQVQPITDKECKLKLEVVGAYSIPDLQYAQVESTFVPENVEPVSQPKAPVKTVTGAPATFWVPGCPQPDCPLYVNVPTPDIPPGATYHGKWSCNRGGYCSCVIPPMKWEHGTCWANGPSRDNGCEYDGQACGSMNGPRP
jgi:hypothetical protein